MSPLHKIDANNDLPSKVDNSSSIMNELKSIVKNEKLGSGGFGTVYKGKFHGKEAAYKIVKMEMVSNRNKMETMKKYYEEYRVQKQAANPRITRYSAAHNVDQASKHILDPFAAFFVEETRSGDMWFIIIFPFCEMNLEDYKNKNVLDEYIIRTILKQLYITMDYLLVSQKVRHQDLKPTNILVEINKGKPTIKLTDFGLSGHWRNSKKRGGTPMYASPEVFGGNQSHVDRFSYGRVCLFLVLDQADFLQLSFVPIEDVSMVKRIRKSVEQFDVLRKIQKMIRITHREPFQNLAKCDEVKITRQMLINAGIPSQWFLDAQDGFLRNYQFK